MAERQKFREWYEERYNCPFPGEVHEMYATVMQRMCDGMAEWADKIAEEAAHHEIRDLGELVAERKGK